MSRLSYYRRVFQAYLGRGGSQLSFWHETPAVNPAAFADDPAQYYMLFREKADYKTLLDGRGVPMLDYRGAIGPQYNPIAIAQYGLGAYNQYRQRKDREYWSRACTATDWLLENLVQNPAGLWVWPHRFDWEYFRKLKSPWYSGLAQGQGVSLLARMYGETGDEKYLQALQKAFQPLVTPIDRGGTLWVDPEGCWWIEEYLTEPPTHIVNGFMWALWGVYDALQLGKKGIRMEGAAVLWEQSLKTLENKLARYDCGFWSLYDLAPVSLRNVASPFYHQLHLVQLDVMSRLTGLAEFDRIRQRWTRYQSSGFCRHRAFWAKVMFKLIYY